MICSDAKGGIDVIFLPLKKIGRKLEREINQLHAYDYPPTGGNFKKEKSNPVVVDSRGGSVFDPFVRMVHGNFLMCFSNRRKNSLTVIESKDGINWHKERNILFGVEGSAWERKVNRGCLIYINKQWYLWYTGQSQLTSCIGLAISDDGNVFQRLSDNPVIIPNLPFEGCAVMNPCVLWDANRKLFRMWYAAGENYEPNVICYAESTDGLCWEKYNSPVIQSDISKKYQKNRVGACDVIQLKDGRFCMAYIAYQNIDVSRICLAYSINGIDNWYYDKANPIISPERGAWDSHAVYKPALCQSTFSDEIYIWYNGRTGSKESIGFARGEV